MYFPRANKFLSKAPLISILLIIIVILGSFIRGSYYYSLLSDPLPTVTAACDIFDQYRFIELTRDILAHPWMGTLVKKYSPAYSYVIGSIWAITRPDSYYVFIFQMIFGVAAIIVMYKTATMVFKNKLIGLIAALLAAFYGPFVFYEGALLRASLIAYFNLFGFYFFVRALSQPEKRLFFIAGLCFGFSFILRPNILFFVLAPFILFQKEWRANKKIVFILFFIFGSLISAAPLTMRSYLLGKKTDISSQGPSTFWIGNTPDATGLGLYRSPLRWKFAEEANGSAIKTLSIFLREIKLNPSAYMKLYGRKIFMFFNGYEIPANMSFDHFAQEHRPLRFAFMRFSLISPFALLGLLLSCKKYRYLNILLTIACTLVLSVLLFHIQGRYRLQAIPFFILFASYGIYMLFYLFKRRKFFFVCKVLVLLFCFFLITWPNQDIINKYFSNYIRPGDFSNKAIAYYLLYENEKDKWTSAQKTIILNKAIEQEQKAVDCSYLEKASNKSISLIKIGIFLSELNKIREAEIKFNEAVRLSPEFEDSLSDIIQQKNFYNKQSIKNLNFDIFTSKKAYTDIFNRHQTVP